MVKFANQQVRAQRKFAQGVYVPPSNAPVDRRPEPLLPAPLDLVTAHVSVNDLLNFVALYKTHHSLQPIVLMKRLTRQQTYGYLRNASGEDKEGEPSQEASITVPSSNPPEAESHPVASSTPRKSDPMNLRSRILTRSWHRKNNDRNKRKPPVTRDRIISRRRRSPSSSVEDNKPLKYFVTKYKSDIRRLQNQDDSKTTASKTVNPSTSSNNERVTRLASLRRQSVIKSKINKTARVLKKQPLRKLKCVAKKTVQRRQQKSNIRKTTKTVSKQTEDSNINGTVIGDENVEKTKIEDATTEVNKTTDADLYHLKSATTERPPVKQTCPDKSGFISLIPPLVKTVGEAHCVPSATPSNRTDIDDGDLSNQEAWTLQLDDEIPSETDVINKRRSVKEWLLNSCSPEINMFTEFKVPEPPRTRMEKPNRIRECECPAWRCASMGVMAKTSPKILELFCGECARCSMFHKVIQLTKHIPNPRNSKFSVASKDHANVSDHLKEEEPDCVSVNSSEKINDKKHVMDIDEPSDDWCIQQQPEAGCSFEGDVYDFDSEIDGPVSTLTPFRTTKLHEMEPECAVQQSAKNVSTKENIQEYYLDIIPGGTHIIKLTQNENKDYETSIVIKDNDIVPLDVEKAENKPMLERAINYLSSIMNKNSTSKPNKGNITNSDGFTCEASTSQSVTQQAQNINSNKEDTIIYNAESQASTTTISSKVDSVQKNTLKVKSKRTINKSLTSESKPVPDRPLTSGILEVPTFYPTAEEMSMDFVEYIQKIAPQAAKFGICKITPPPEFKTDYVMKNVQFKINNQYISTMFDRWGNASKEMTAIKAHLATQNVPFTRPPLFEGIEVDLVKLYHQVQRHGGLKAVIEQQKWGRIAEAMQLNSDRIKADLKLDKIYCKHLLPYDTLTALEREDLISKVDKIWQKRFKRMCERAANPLHRKRRLLGESDSSEDEPEQEFESRMADAFVETEDCVVPGQRMNYTRFSRVAEQVQRMHFPVSDTISSPEVIERLYWLRVLRGDEHVCVYSASLDTSADGLGFPSDGTHPWNLKRLGESDSNVLSALGPTLAVTVPTLHLSMMFSTNCWHMDPHRLPWTEYMHSGPTKIWYGIPEEQGDMFRAAVEQLCPTAVQNKSIWLPSDITMIPPELLVQRGVTLSRLQQKPGDYVIVFPRAYSCSISTGSSISESLYFATESWLNSVEQVFLELRSNCEPAMFSLEQLATGIWRGKKPERARYLLEPMLTTEREHRLKAAARRLTLASPRELLAQNRRLNASSWQLKRDECDVCRTTLYFSKMVGVSPSRTSVCLPHGLQIFDQSPTKSDEVLCILFVSDEEIIEMLYSLTKSPLYNTAQTHATVNNVESLILQQPSRLNLFSNFWPQMVFKCDVRKITKKARPTVTTKHLQA